MAPGDVAHVPRTPSPVAGAGPVAEHFRSRARLRRLLVRLGRPTLHRPRCGLRQGGFAHYVRLRHYRSSLLAGASNALTFVRGADRACCAPRKRRCDLICAPRKRRCDLICAPRKWLCRPTNACLYRPPARPPEGHWRAHLAAAPCRRTRQRHLAARTGKKKPQVVCEAT